MARKPLLGGPVLNRDDVQSRLAGDDLMSRVIGNDAVKHGRTPAAEHGRAPSPAPPGPEEQIENVTTLQRTPEATKESSGEYSNDVTQKRENEASSERPNERPGERSNASTTGRTNARIVAPADPDGGTAARMAAALEKAQSDEVAVVTVRAPQRLNAYIDRYVERVNRVSPRRKFRKQDAVAEMFAWFYASHPMPPAPDEEDL